MLNSLTKSEFSKSCWREFIFISLLDLKIMLEKVILTPTIVMLLHKPNKFNKLKISSPK